jgi:hypothetical protein
MPGRFVKTFFGDLAFSESARSNDLNRVNRVRALLRLAPTPAIRRIRKASVALVGRLPLIW